MSLMEPKVCGRCGHVHYGYHRTCAECLIAKRVKRKSTAHCHRCWQFGHTVKDCPLPRGEEWATRNLHG